MIGKRINARYHILESIGGGGMAFVYKARDIILERDVAVKILQPQFSRDEQFITRFRREAQAATSLSHPNVVNIFDVGEEDDIYYIVMEYVEGPTLKELIQKEGALSLEDSVQIMVQVASAIGHAHDNHLVHRDIKPHNILIGKNGVAKVADFGIARAMSSATITHTNSVMGSVHYLSPEQARGGVVNYKSDIYSLGIVLYEMVTGVLPFSGDTAVSIAIKHLQNDVPPPRKLKPSIPQSMENVILRATAKDPFQRYEHVQAMEEDIATALSPSRLNEPKFTVPSDEEATKAIPIIKEGMFEDNDHTIEANVMKDTAVSNKHTAQPDPPKKQGKTKKWLVGMLLTFIILIGSVVAAFAVLPSLLKVDEVEIPDVVGLEYEEAEKMLLELGLEVVREEEYHDEKAAEEVFLQDPKPYSVVKVNTPVKLYVSIGKEMTSMIDLIGMQRSSAERLLVNFAETQYIPKETGEFTEGTIIDQNPEPGTLIIIEEQKVYITYSIEPMVELGNLEGYSDQAVRQYLNENRLLIELREEFSDTVEKGYVIRQSPGPFTRLKKGSEVEIVLSKGKEEPAPDPVRIKEAVIEVEAKDGEHGISYDILITYEDATTDGETEFKQETITESKTYRVPIQVSREKEAIVRLYVDGELQKTTPITY